MKKLFIESRAFTNQIAQFLEEEEYAAFQSYLMQDPERGSVIPGCGGLRKVRLSQPSRQKGKRGGARVIYLHIPEADWIFLLDVYGKNEKVNLTGRERKMLKKLVDQLKHEAIQKALSGKEKNNG
jgi:mRNA-degrading endonuclease RelE of RelBE toxin-antitoxin system